MEDEILANSGIESDERNEIDESFISLTEVPLECCGNGCNPCILDVQKELTESQYRSAKNNLLTLTSYKTFFVSSTLDFGDSYLLIKLNWKGDAAGKAVSLNPGQHVVLRISSVTRPFTPLSWTSASLLFLVKLYEKGIFSQHLRQLKEGDSIDIRGPYGQFVYNENSFGQVIMLSIGTGIAPMYSIAKSIIDNEMEETKVHLIAGFRSLNCVPLKKNLRVLSDYWNFTCTLQISQYGATDGMTGINIESGRLDKNKVSNLLESHCPETTLILICGTPEFNESVEHWVRGCNFNHLHVFK
ncbi:NADH-cytochrome b5 reductase-like [Orussus abietinus]|uniref:NADH-cytochrome b5 reductase-like n=1 Tax=Orussus abietinus TaxID=222816 RepID=UPI0006268448|nr:NADH-cytochrome b5 reductase-like [Orussus abietinus]XP_012270860.1 NADH-cytochrome b5 reductase-like [Orussus abietinus]